FYSILRVNQMLYNSTRNALSSYSPLLLPAAFRILFFIEIIKWLSNRVKVRYKANHDNGRGSLFAPSLYRTFWAYSLIRSNGTKLSLRVEWTMRIDEAAILTSVKVSTFAKDFGIF
ncbi:MAG: hypothetical protein ACRD4W_10135, partial [Nitrososphaeraceae archaeon]